MDEEVKTDAEVSQEEEEAAVESAPVQEGEEKVN